MKKIKNIATSSIVGSLLFVSSGTVGAQIIPKVTPTSTKSPSTNIEIDSVAPESIQNLQENNIGVEANDEFENESKDLLLEQGFNPSQIQKIYNSSRNSKSRFQNIDGE